MRNVLDFLTKIVKTMSSANFSDLGKIEAIRVLFENSPFKRAESSAFLCGKDGAVIRTASSLWLEGMDFDLTYFPLKHLGYKCVIGTVGELYAKLAQPQSLSVRLGVSAKLDFDQISELWSGICLAAKEHGIQHADLDLQPSQNGLTVSIVVTGYSDSDTANAQPKTSSKDLLCLSGSVGAAFLGLSLLGREKKKFEDEKKLSGQLNLEKYKMLVGDYLKPDLAADTVKQLHESGIVPSYGCFLKNGLADAAKRIQEQTGLGVKIYTDKIPFEGNSFEAGKELNIDPVSAALNGGQDFRLLFVIPLAKYETFRHDFQTFSIIGHLAKQDVGAVIVTPDGAELPIHAQGWKEDI